MHVEQKKLISFTWNHRGFYTIIWKVQIAKFSILFPGSVHDGPVRARAASLPLPERR